MAIAWKYADRPVYMIDASHGFIKDGNKNRLRERDIHKITDAYTREAKERFVAPVLFVYVAVGMTSCPAWMIIADGSP